MVEVDSGFVPTYPEAAVQIGAELVANPNCIPNCLTATVPYKDAIRLAGTAILHEKIARSYDGCQGLRDSADDARERAEIVAVRSNATSRECPGRRVRHLGRFITIEWCRAKCTAEEGERPHFFERLTVTRGQKTDQS